MKQISVILLLITKSILLIAQNKSSIYKNGFQNLVWSKDSSKLSMVSLRRENFKNLDVNSQIDLQFINEELAEIKTSFIRRILFEGKNNYNPAYLKNDLQKYLATPNEDEFNTVAIREKKRYDSSLKTPLIIYTKSPSAPLFDAWYVKILLSQNIPTNIDSSFNTLLKNESDYVRKLLRTIQYEGFIYSNKKDATRFLSKIEEVKNVVRQFNDSTRKMMLCNTIANAYLQSNDYYNAYKYYLYALDYSKSTESEGNVEYYNTDMLIYIITLLSRYEENSFFLEKISDILHNKIKQPDRVTVFTYPDKSLFFSNIESLVLVNSFDFKLAQDLTNENERRATEDYFINELIYNYDASNRHSIQLKDFTRYQCNISFADYIKNNYPDSEMSLYYYLQAFGYSAKDLYSQAYIKSFEKLVKELIRFGYYDQAKKLIDITILSKVTGNIELEYSSKYCLMYYYLAQKKLDSAEQIYSKISQVSEADILKEEYSDRRIQKAYYKCMELISNYKNDTTHIFEGILGQSVNTYSADREYGKILRKDEEYIRELKESELKDIISVKNNLLADKEKMILQKTKELEELNDNIQTVKQKLIYKTQTLSSTSIELGIIKAEKREIEENIINLRKDSTELSNANIQAKKDIQAKQKTIDYLTLIFSIIAVCLIVILIFIVAYYSIRLKAINYSLAQTNIELDNTVKKLKVAYNELEIEKKEKIKAIEEAAFYKSNFLIKRLDAHNMKGGLPSLVSNLGFLKFDVSKLQIANNKINTKTKSLHKRSMMLKDYVITCLENSKYPLISLEKEIENASKYLEICNYSNSYNVNFDTDLISSKIIDIKFPANMLQPIIQNIMDHAFSENDEIEQKIIHLDIKEEKGFKTLVIIDNGIGLSNSNKLKNAIGNNSKISLQDIEKYLETLRIQAITNITFKESQEFMYDNPFGRGTVVKFKNIA